jgi:hypothetical protein
MSVSKSRQEYSLLDLESAELVKNLKGIQGSELRKFSSARNIDEDEFSTGDAITYLEKQEVVSDVIHKVVENRYWKSLEDMLDTAVEQGYLSKESKEIDSPYTDETVDIYSLEPEQSY